MIYSISGYVNLIIYSFFSLPLNSKEIHGNKNTEMIYYLSKDYGFIGGGL